MVLGLLVLIGATGCGVVIPAKRSVTKLVSLSIGMTPDQVALVIGEPSEVRAAETTRDGKSHILHEHDLYTPRAAMWHGINGPFSATITWWVPFHAWTRPYWMTYIDGKLERWGRAGDWRPDVVQDVTVRGEKK